MGRNTPFRTFVSMLILATLLGSAVVGDCVACVASTSAKLAPRSCCLPDGSCPASSNMARCPKAQLNHPVVVEQTAPPASPLTVADAPGMFELPAISPSAALALVAFDSPPSGTALRI